MNTLCQREAIGRHLNFARDPKYSRFYEHSKIRIHILNIFIIYPL